MNVKWFALIGFILTGIFTFIFAWGMVFKSKSEIRRQKKVNLERIKELTTLYTITSTVCHSRKLDQILHSVLDNVLKILKLDGGVIFLLDKESGNLSLKAHRGVSKKFVEKLSKVSQKDTISTKAVNKNEIIFVENISKSNNPNKEHLLEEEVYGVIAVPLRSDSKVLGVIAFGTKKARKYSSQDVRLFDSIGNELGLAIDNKESAENLEKVYLSTVLTLADIVEAKDHYMRSHSSDVARYAVIIAQELELSDEEIEKLRVASRLHDLGKIGISDFILLKKGKLNDEEWEQIRKHPERAVEILKPLTSYEDSGILEYIRSHHERYDGKGYPDGFKENQIKLGARIITVADAFHAMTSSRPYRKKPLTLERAREELNKNAGLQFDPEIVGAFIRALKKKEKSKDKY